MAAKTDKVVIDGVEITRGTIEVEGERLATETFTYDGQVNTIRELLTFEGDEAWDASEDKDKDPAKFNQRLNTRLQLAKASVEPKRTVEDVAKMGSRKFVLVLRSFNRLNSLPEANPTLPAGSAGPTSPDTGAPSPTT